MTVIFIKRECDRHPGCFTMGDKCDRCHDEDFRKDVDRIIREHGRKLGELLRIKARSA